MTKTKKMKKRKNQREEERKKKNRQHRKKIIITESEEELEGAVAQYPITDSQDSQESQDERKEETTKRPREVIDSPTDAKEEEKKQKRDEKPQRTTKLEPQVVPPVPEPPKMRQKTGKKVLIKGPIARAESLTRLNLTSEEDIKAMDITFYVPHSAKHNVTPEGIERIRNHYIQGRAKATWRNPNVDRRHLVKAMLQGMINSEDCHFYGVDDEEFDRLKEGYIQPRRHSSTTYDI